MRSFSPFATEGVTSASPMHRPRVGEKQVLVTRPAIWPPSRMRCDSRGRSVASAGRLNPTRVWRRGCFARMARLRLPKKNRLPILNPQDTDVETIAHEIGVLAHYDVPLL